MVGGAEALRLGIADCCVADGEVMSTAVARASEFAQLPSGAFAKMKQRLVNASPSLEEELKREEEDQTACLLGGEFREGFAAFSEKRAADFLKLPRERD
jgi:2-(1,2-epoxy-1,2-dihydrophenyl)acetyl-CoA isomerase